MWLQRLRAGDIFCFDGCYLLGLWLLLCLWTSFWLLKEIGRMVVTFYFVSSLINRLGSRPNPITTFWGIPLRERERGRERFQNIYIPYKFIHCIKILFFISIILDL